MQRLDDLWSYEQDGHIGIDPFGLYATKSTRQPSGLEDGSNEKDERCRVHMIVTALILIRHLSSLFIGSRRSANGGSCGVTSEPQGE